MRHTIVRLGAVAALLGGLAWMLRGLWVLVSGTEPPVVIGLGPVFFLGALVGLIALVPVWSLRLRIVAGLVTAAAVLYGATTILHFAATGSTAEGFLRLLSLIVLIVALIVVGKAIKQHDALPGNWRALPMWLGMLIIPLIVVVGIASTAAGGGADRLVELPLVLFGLGWVLVGIQMLRAAHAGVHSGSKSSAAELMQ